jgi:hypothetical protein
LAGRPRTRITIKDFLQTLKERYGVTESVAAWKLEHGLHSRNVDLRALLDSVVPYR